MNFGYNVTHFPTIETKTWKILFAVEDQITLGFLFFFLCSNLTAKRHLGCPPSKILEIRKNQLWLRTSLTHQQQDFSLCSRTLVHLQLKSKVIPVLVYIGSSKWRVFFVFGDLNVYMTRCIWALAKVGQINIRCIRMSLNL